MRTISVKIDDELWAATRRRAFDSGVTLTEVVQRLLAAYVDGKVRVNGVLAEGGGSPRELGPAVARTEGQRIQAPEPTASVPAPSPAASALDSLLEAGRKQRAAEEKRPPEVDDDGVVDSPYPYLPRLQRFANAKDYEDANFDPEDFK